MLDTILPFYKTCNRSYLHLLIHLSSIEISTTTWPNRYWQDKDVLVALYILEGWSMWPGVESRGIGGQMASVVSVITVLGGRASIHQLMAWVLSLNTYLITEIRVQEWWKVDRN